MGLAVDPREGVPEGRFELTADRHVSCSCRDIAGEVPGEEANGERSSDAGEDGAGSR
jgi:hypothetical protein